jgi:hypothetical protein
MNWSKRFHVMHQISACRKRLLSWKKPSEHGEN